MGSFWVPQRGQAIVEFALVVPVLVFLILGAFDVSILASNKGIAISAVRHGARLGAELGGITSGASCQGTVPSGTADSLVDNAILNDVLAAAFEKKNAAGRHLSGMNSVTVNEVDIYRVPTAQTADGTYQAGYHANRYTVTSVGGGTSWAFALQPPATYPLSERCQGPLDHEAEIGVRINWTYSPVNHIPAQSLPAISDFAVEKENLCNTNCLP
jgi:Flp pilus assembly protein TadG